MCAEKIRAGGALLLVGWIGLIDPVRCDAEILAEAGPGAPGGAWSLAGGARLAAEGVVLAENAAEVGALLYGEPIPTGRLAIRMEVLLGPSAACGADGFALRLSAEPAGLGGAGSGLGYAGAASPAIAVEFDLWGNPGADPAAPGPAGAHVGIAASATGFSAGPVPTPAWAPLAIAPGRWSFEVDLEGGHVIVRGARAGEPLSLWLDRIIETPAFDAGYLAITGANGSIAGVLGLARIEVERPAAAPPRIRRLREDGGAVRIEWEEPTSLESIDILRDGIRIGSAAGGTGAFTDRSAPAGAHDYELRGRSPAGGVPPTRARFVAGPQALLFDPLGLAGTPGSAAAAIERLLRRDGIRVAVARDLATVDLERFTSIWWANGSVPRQHTPRPAEEARLLEYLQGATPEAPRALYAEGGDLFAFLPRHALGDADGVVGLEDGGADALDTLRPAVEGIGPVPYTGSSYEVDRLGIADGECPGCDVTPLLTDPEGAAVVMAVVDEDGGARMVLSAVELAGMAAGDARREVFRTYRGVLGIPEGPPSFIRGDAGGDGTLDLGDGIGILNYLFAGGPPSPCPDAADTNDGGGIDIADAILIFNALFGGAGLPEPGLECGPDPTPDGLGPCDHAACR